MPTTEKLRLVSREEACQRLGCSKNTFFRKWHRVFTETREIGKRERFERKVYSDELDCAIENASKAAAAVANLRRKMKRL
ncbi:hypothetical protein [Frigoriglobus tundricola]|uniref:Uncharacterized protein n=1 Tax=Frigoriglobus tundricola TaxID=2774151 RepID=A0A6M5YIG3_9BACT|nr:hypothetical protein [Frigoriglobus tundricola]QJW93110.1 hypothetical protein FTUN_0613 [Frigoriglobus tundricola]